MNKFTKKFDQKVVDDYYLQELKKGNNLYGSIPSQIERFKNILRYFGLDGKKVLDVGCGRGDLLKYLVDRGIKPSRFTGIDPLKDMIKEAKELDKEYGGEINTTWAKKNYLDVDVEGGVDVIIAFSIFDRKFGNMPDTVVYAKKMLEKMVHEASEGVYVTFLSAYKTIDEEAQALFYPEKVFQFAHTLSERVVIDHSYMPHSFSVIIYKGKSAWRKYWEKGKYGITKF